MTYIWPCKLTGRTHHPSGKLRTINATIEGAGDVHAAIYDYMAKRRNAGEWLGCKLIAMTPLGQRCVVTYEPNGRSC
jgi:hypothetical protein